MTPTQAETLVQLVEQTDLSVFELSRCLSLAVRVEPQLVRRMRLVIDRFRDAGPELEADVWTSPFVMSAHSLAFSFWPEVARVLRERLRGDRALMDTAWTIVQSLHTASPEVLRAEERMVYHSLRGAEGEAASGAVREELQRAVVSATKERPGIARWLIEALPRLPLEARSAPEFTHAAIRASASLGVPKPFADLTRPDGATESWLTRGFEVPQRDVNFGLRRRLPPETSPFNPERSLAPIVARQMNLERDWAARVLLQEEDVTTTTAVEIDEFARALRKRIIGEVVPRVLVWGSGPLDLFFPSSLLHWDLVRDPEQLATVQAAIKIVSSLEQAHWTHEKPELLTRFQDDPDFLAVGIVCGATPLEQRPGEPPWIGFLDTSDASEELLRQQATELMRDLIVNLPLPGLKTELVIGGVGPGTSVSVPDLALQRVHVEAIGPQPTEAFDFDLDLSQQVVVPVPAGRVRLTGSHGLDVTLEPVPEQHLSRLRRASVRLGTGHRGYLMGRRFVVTATADERFPDEVEGHFSGMTYTLRKIGQSEGTVVLSYEDEPMPFLALGLDASRSAPPVGRTWVAFDNGGHVAAEYYSGAFDAEAWSQRSEWIAKISPERLRTGVPLMLDGVIVGHVAAPVSGTTDRVHVTPAWKVLEALQDLGVSRDGTARIAPASRSSHTAETSQHAPAESESGPTSERNLGARVRAEIDFVRAETDPTLQNLSMAQTYYELSTELCQTLGSENLNYCSFAVWTHVSVANLLATDGLADVVFEQLRRGGLEKELPFLETVRASLPESILESAKPVLEPLREELRSLTSRFVEDQVKVFAELADKFAVLAEALRQGKPVEHFVRQPPEAWPHLSQAFKHYLEASHARDPHEKAELMLLSNGLAALHEHTQLQPLVRNLMDALKEATSGPVKEWIGSQWEAVASAVISKLILPEPSDSSVSTPEPLMQLVNPELRQFMSGFAERPSDPDGLRTNSVDLEERMRYVVSTLRSHQQDKALLAAPLTAEQERTLLARRDPPA